MKQKRITGKIIKNSRRHLNKAVQFHCLFQEREILSSQLQKDSGAVQKESMKVLYEFEKFQE